MPPRRSRRARASASSAATAPASRRCSRRSAASSRPRRGRSPFRRAGASAASRRKRPNGPESLIEVVLAADLERAALLHEAETAQDPHRIAEIQTRLADIDAHAAPARAAAILSGLGFSDRRPGAPLRGIFRRLAHARRARRDAVRRARSAAARRADQLSRSRRHAVARGPSRALSAHRDRHQPRPRPARQLGRPHPASGAPRS